MQNEFDPLRIFLAAFTISSLGGLAALLRSKRDITWRIGISASLYSGLMGLIIALLWYNYYDGDGNMYFLLGISGLAGIGGTTVVDFIIQVLKKGGVNITIAPVDGDAPTTQETDDVDISDGEAGC